MEKKLRRNVRRYSPRVALAESFAFGQLGGALIRPRVGHGNALM
jgi:hypothetical protein